VPIHHIRSVVMFAAMLLMLWAWWRIPPPRPRVFNIMALIAALAVPVEIFGYATSLYNWNNSIVYNVFTWIEFGLALGMVVDQDRRLRWAALVAAVLGTLGMAWDRWMMRSWDVLLIDGILIMAFLLAVMVSALLWHMARHSQVPLHRLPVFWLFMGMLAYFGGILPVVGMALYIYTRDTMLVALLWTVVPVLCAVRYLLAAYACWSLASPSRSAAHG
jgi:hypothetical protein